MAPWGVNLHVCITRERWGRVRERVIATTGKRGWIPTLFIIKFRRCVCVHLGTGLEWMARMKRNNKTTKGKMKLSFFIFCVIFLFFLLLPLLQLLLSAYSPIGCRWWRCCHYCHKMGGGRRRRVAIVLLFDFVVQKKKNRNWNEIKHNNYNKWHWYW